MSELPLSNRWSLERKPRPALLKDEISLDIGASFPFNENDSAALPLDSTNSKHGFAYEEPTHGSEFEQADEKESLFEVNEPWGGFFRFRVIAMAAENFKRKPAPVFSAQVVGDSRAMGNDESAILLTMETFKGIVFDPMKQLRGGAQACGPFVGTS
jgi:hypothetical protein